MSKSLLTGVTGQDGSYLFETDASSVDNRRGKALT
jgi:GDP-D-mannose dehydratase